MDRARATARGSPATMRSTSPPSTPEGYFRAGSGSGITRERDALIARSRGTGYRQQRVAERLAVAALPNDVRVVVAIDPRADHREVHLFSIEPPKQRGRLSAGPAPHLRACGPPPCRFLQDR